MATVVTSLSCKVAPEQARVVHAGRRDPTDFALDNPVPPDPQQPLRSWKDVSEPMPPLAPPSSTLVSVRERSDLSFLEKEWSNRYAELEKLWVTMPIKCRVRDCLDDWRAFNAALFKQDANIASVGPGICGPNWSEGISRRLRNDRHATFLKQLTVELRSHMLSLVVASGDVEFYRKIDEGGSVVRFGACLQCIIQPVVVAEVATFDPGSSDIAPGDKSLLEPCARLLNQNSETIHSLRGHAEPDEGADALALSHRRADAVRAVLIEHGVKTSQLEVVALGDAIPVGRPGERINRRVEIEPKTRWK